MEVSAIKRPFPIAVAAILLVLTVATAVQAQQPVERTLRLEEKLEYGVENAVAYVAVEYTKPNSPRRYLESGTGFFVAANNLITNHHVVAAALEDPDAKIKVRVFSGTEQSRFYPASIVKTDPRVDLALLAVQGDLPAIQPVQVAPELPRRQTGVFAFGFPLGTMLDKSVNGPNVCLRRGYVSRTINDGGTIESDLNIDKGISGGPLVDEDGVVRGVVRAMAGSDFNKNFAAISVASPVLLDFCSQAGSRVTLRGGQIVEPGTRVTALPEGQPEPEPRPIAGIAAPQGVLRAYFALGSALRLSTLVPRILLSEQLGYSSEIRQTSQSNAELVAGNLEKVKAPVDLRKQAQELSLLLVNPAAPLEADCGLSSAYRKALRLEEACDGWVKGAEEPARLNYGFGAWLTELSLGCLDPQSDLRNCAYFLGAAQRWGTSSVVVRQLGRLRQQLAVLQM
ncbi:MAG: serine protease, partial [Armatimonadia bacterium]